MLVFYLPRSDQGAIEWSNKPWLDYGIFQCYCFCTGLLALAISSPLGQLAANGVTFCMRKQAGGQV
jgi:hypothetical protein